MIPKTFKVDLPEDLVKEALKCKNDAEAERVGIEWCVTNAKELMSHMESQVFISTLSEQ